MNVVKDKVEVEWVFVDYMFLFLIEIYCVFERYFWIVCYIFGMGYYKKIKVVSSKSNFRNFNL